MIVVLLRLSTSKEPLSYKIFERRSSILYKREGVFLWRFLRNPEAQIRAVQKSFFADSSRLRRSFWFIVVVIFEAFSLKNNHNNEPKAARKRAARGRMATFE